MSDQSINSLLRSEANSLPTVELLGKPVKILQGVSDEAEKALRSIDVETVLDLAASSVFRAATELTAAGLPESRLAMLGHVPADMIVATARTVPLNELYSQDISILKNIDSATATALQGALSISTVRDLALWPPYLAAVQILNEVYGLQDGVGDDPESPQELVPRAGQLPTERVQYSIVLFDRILNGQDRSGSLTMIPSRSSRPSTGARTNTGDLTLSLANTGPLPIETAGPLDISLATQEFGFTKPALGAILTMTQSWFTHGLALGQLLHTVALAPGESTRIAMIDWSRTERGTSTEDVAQNEQLWTDLVRNRSISEVINAVAKEAQKGFSTAMGGGTGTGVGEGGGGAGAGQYEMFKFAGAAGNSSGWGLSGGQAIGWASSNGRREIDAEMTQQVLDATHQASSSVRNRIATKVVEVSQSESERVSTRAITNFNHMHALSIQYYEVVQLYRVAVETTRVDACLFVPMKPLDFHDPAVRERFKHVLGIAALTPQARQQAQVVTNQIAISSPDRVPPWPWVTIYELGQLFGSPVGKESDENLVLPLAFTADRICFSYRGDSTSLYDSPFECVEIEFGNGKTKAYAIDYSGAKNEYGDYEASFGDEFKADISNTCSFWNVEVMRLKRASNSLDWSGTIGAYLSLTLIKPGQPGTGHSAYLQAKIRARANETTTIVYKMQRTSSTTVSQETTPNAFDEQAFEDQLVRNSLYYSQVIWSSLDAATLGMLLSNYTLGGRPLIELVDPLPVSMAGNYLAFRMHVEEETAWWETFLQDRGLRVGVPREDLVPMPTGGVFAEAVLGRFNSAEKLDITRFWNWQDSPIPIVAPEIAAISTGSRAQPLDLTTGDLNAPVVTISNPPALPEPQGLVAALTALANGNMFRDMSGLAGTIGFAQAAMQAATQAATTFGQQAGQNAATAADLLAKMYGGGGGSGAQGATGSKPSPTSPSTISNAGGRINYGEKLDQQKQSTSSGNGSSSGNGTGGSGSVDGGSSAAEDAFYTDLGAYEGSAGGGGGVLGQIMNAVMGATGKPATKRISVTRSTPGWRACCALQYAEALDPAALKGHQYGRLIHTDPVGYVYTEKVGLVDLGHVRDNADMTKFVYDALIQGATELQLYSGVASIKGIPWDKYSILELAAAVAYVESWAHELATWGTSEDYSSFSPEDLPSNIIGIELGKRAMNIGGKYEATIDTELDAMVQHELKARTKADTEAVFLATRKSKWWDMTKLLRRNFDGTPWMAGMPYDAPASFSWLSPVVFEPYYGKFEYVIRDDVDGKPGVTLKTMKTETEAIHVKFVAAHPGMDKP